MNYKIYQLTNKNVLCDVGVQLNKTLKIHMKDDGSQCLIICRKNAKYWIRNVFYDRLLIKLLKGYFYDESLSIQMLVEMFDSCELFGLTNDIADIIRQYVAFSTQRDRIDYHNVILQKYLKKHKFTKSDLDYSLMYV